MLKCNATYYNVLKMSNIDKATIFCHKFLSCCIQLHCIVFVILYLLCDLGCWHLRVYTIKVKELLTVLKLLD